MNNPFFNKLRRMNHNEFIKYTDKIIKEYKQNKEISDAIILWQIYYYLEGHSNFYTATSIAIDPDLLTDKEILRTYNKLFKLNKFEKRLKQVIVDNELYRYRSISMTIDKKSYPIIENNFEKEMKKKKTCLINF